MTGAEKRLWRELREFGSRPRFRRQHPIGGHIVDFACPAAKLVIELDGRGCAGLAEAIKIEASSSRGTAIGSSGSGTEK